MELHFVHMTVNGTTDNPVVVTAVVVVALAMGAMLSAVIASARTCFAAEGEGHIPRFLALLAGFGSMVVGSRLLLGVAARVVFALTNTASAGRNVSLTFLGPAPVVETWVASLGIATIIVSLWHQS
jgi:hypothetical protein